MWTKYKEAQMWGRSIQILRSVWKGRGRNLAGGIQVEEKPEELQLQKPNTGNYMIKGMISYARVGTMNLCIEFRHIGVTRFQAHNFKKSIVENHKISLYFWGYFHFYSSFHRKLICVLLLLNFQHYRISKIILNKSQVGLTLFPARRWHPNGYNIIFYWVFS